jgi:hypothetical protein
MSSFIPHLSITLEPVTRRSGQRAKKLAGYSDSVKKNWTCREYYQDQRFRYRNRAWPHPLGRRLSTPRDPDLTSCCLAG